MNKMTRGNLRNIRRYFQEQTGVALDPVRRKRLFSVRKIWLPVAAVLACLAMSAFTYPLFSSLNGDELSFSSAVYEGNGIVSIVVENRSDKMLEFQPDAKLMRWVTGKELPRMKGKPVFTNRVVGPHSSATMTIDLSDAYDMQAIEENYNREEWFYLVLTNNGFLFGQDWMCSVNLGRQDPEPAAAEESAAVSVSAAPEILEEVEEELQFYFANSYTEELLAFNEANFLYQQKVEELLARFGGRIVPALGPMVMVGGPSEFLDPEPIMGKPHVGTVFDKSVPEEQQYLLTLSDWTYTDAYGRMVATADEKSWAQTVTIPQRKGETDGGVGLPLIFLFVYDAGMAQPENYAFIYGRIHSFADLEAYKVLEDEHYAVYDATALIYTDVDAYLDDFLAARPDVYCDEQIRQRVHNVYGFYQDRENIRTMYGYLRVPE
ncbi:MAG: hypothetical protein IJE81_01860 [Oscillospiraceae bacterium]|nr:hypothetical protein [Oscillospiraceae bacterium]MBQ7129651.1 hypothetical protein [Oscillospiraceae bacterium]